MPSTKQSNDFTMQSPTNNQFPTCQNILHAFLEISPSQIKFLHVKNPLWYVLKTTSNLSSNTQTEFKIGKMPKEGSAIVPYTSDSVLDKNWSKSHFR